MRRLAAAAFALGAPLLLAAAVLAGLGYDPIAALAALLRGTVGSWERFLSVTLVRACPLLLTGLGVAVAFRAGIFNIGADGQFYLGALAAAAGGARAGLLGVLGAPLLLTAAALAGAGWAAIAAGLRRRFRVPEVISTLMLNFVAELLVSYAVHGPLMERRGTYPQTDPVAASARLPLLLPPSRLHAGVLLALLIAPLIGWLLRSTVFGFRLRATGHNPIAARFAGRFDAARVQTRAFLLSGALAGLGGGIELLGLTQALYEKFSPGYGYTAIAVALLARLNPLAVAGSAVFFGVLEGGASAMQRESGVPAVVVYSVEALLILGVLLSDRLWRRELA
ncbi:MAG TPA: ABC transporter permease [Acidobacteriota bacterium]